MRHFPDGSLVERVAVEVSPQGNERRRWRDVESAHGSELALYTDGSLGLFDNEGFIRRAQPMPRELRSEMPEMTHNTALQPTPLTRRG